jgi:hypothetical protein
MLVTMETLTTAKNSDKTTKFIDFLYTGWTFEFRTLCPNKKPFLWSHDFEKFNFLNDRSPSTVILLKFTGVTKYHTAWEKKINVKFFFLDFLDTLNFFELKNLFQNLLFNFF